MQETLKYIKVLNWGYGGFSPITLNQDFKSSLEQLQKRLALLDELSYEALLVEATSANGKANLEKYKSTDTTFEYQLHFMRDRQQLLEALPTMFKGFKKGVDKFRTDDLWTDEQWREYRVTLNQIENQFEERLRQFAAAYDYKTEQQPEPQQAKESPQEQQPSKIPTIYDNEKERMVFGRALEKGYMKIVNGCYKWHKSKSLLAYMCGKLYCGDKVKEDDYGDELQKGNNQMPASEVKRLFGADVASNRYSLKNPPRQYYLVDDLFKGASK